MENLTQTERKPADELFAQLLSHEPKIIEKFVPKNASEQKAAFLADEVRNPVHSYERLHSIDFINQHAAIEKVGHKIVESLGDDYRFLSVYEQFVSEYQEKTHLLELANAYNRATDTAEKSQLRAAYMEQNIEIYGEPDRTTYDSLLY